MMNRNSESGHFYFVPHFGGNTSSLPPFSRILAGGFLQLSFVRWQKLLLFLLIESFCHECWTSQMLFLPLLRLLYGICCGSNYVRPKYILKSQLPVSENVTFLGNKVIDGVNEFKGGHTGLGWTWIQWMVSLSGERDLKTKRKICSKTVFSIPGSYMRCSNLCLHLPMVFLCVSVLNTGQKLWLSLN